MAFCLRGPSQAGLLASFQGRFFGLSERLESKESTEASDSGSKEDSAGLHRGAECTQGAGADAALASPTADTMAACTSGGSVAGVGLAWSAIMCCVRAHLSHQLTVGFVLAGLTCG